MRWSKRISTNVCKQLQAIAKPTSIGPSRETEGKPELFMNTFRSLLASIRSRIEPVSRECAQSEAETIIKHVFQCTRNELFSDCLPAVSDKQIARIDAIVNRLLTNEPLPYIIGSAYFHSKEFKVSPGVLIPRPDTETLVDKVLELERNDVSSFIDVGTGSGAIAESIRMQRPHWKAVGLDISESALKIAKGNCGPAVRLICSDLFSAIKPGNYFDFIVSNPPYISEIEMKELDASVKDFEPALALFGGKDGLDFYRALSKTGKAICKPEARIYCEIGYLQAEAVRNIFEENGWKNVRQFQDLAGRPRVVSAQL